MTFDSSNREEYENNLTTESLMSQIRLAMSQGCVRPCHVFDLVDEALDRLDKQIEVLNRVHDYLGELIRDNLVADASRASDLADEVWDVLHRGDDAWRRVYKTNGRRFL